jgi:protease-4
LRRLFEQLAFDPRVKGAVVRIRCQASASVYQSLREIFEQFRAQDKRLVAYSTGFGPFQYYLACACDQIVMPPPAEWAVLGLAQDHVFLKDALAALGIEVEVLHVSPFKSAGDQLARTDFSPESRAQAEWLLDANWQELLRGISHGRKLDVERIKTLIDSGPHSAEMARAHGLIDATVYEDELDAWLIPDSERPAPQPPGAMRKLLSRIKRGRDAGVATAAKPEPAMLTLEEAHDALMIKPLRYSHKRIGIIPIEGMIIDGSSQSSPLPVPLVGGTMAGDETIAQMVRKAERDDSLAAIIVYVNSPGGSALSSDLMARELSRLNRKKPVITYMGGVAASGGYYVSAPTRHITAQPLTLTGSIGVVLTKPAAQSALATLKLHHRVLKRGERADAITPFRPFTEGEHAAFTEMMRRTYDAFKAIVGRGRNLPAEALEPICGGRVWSGAMAHERKLVDSLGSFSVALAKARELAGLADEPRVPAVLVSPDRKHRLLPASWRNAIAGLVELARIPNVRLSPKVWAINEILPDQQLE